MTTYLTIITTVLVLTQIIRISQNHISLRRQKIIFEKEVKQLNDIDIRKEDFDYQKKAYRLIAEKLETELLKEIDGN